MRTSEIFKNWLHPLMSLGGIEAYYTSRGDCVEVDESYSGFNLCHYTGDSQDKVVSCRKILCETLGIEDSCLLVPCQTHSTNVLLVDNLPLENGCLDNIDALVTNLEGVVVGVSTADCVPVVMVDEYAHVVGVAHAGWRGAVNGVVENMLHVMMGIGAEPSRIKMAIGPSICADCFEVGEEVAEQFPEDCVGRHGGWSKPHVNLQRYIVQKMLKEGVMECNVSDFRKNMCTKCHPERYFSARALGVKSGRIFTFVKT